jgi:hypothetical protein
MTEIRTHTGLSLGMLRDMAMKHVRRGRKARWRPNPVVTQLDALNDLIDEFYAGDRRPQLQDRIATLLYAFLEAPMKGTRMPGVDMEDVRQDVIAKLWDRLLSGHLKKDLPIRAKGYFGLMFRNQAIDALRKRREASMEGIREIASTGVSLTSMPLTEEELQAAVTASAEISGQEAASMGPGKTYLTRWYGRRPDVVVAHELEVTPENLRVRAHRAGITVFAGNKPTGKGRARKLPELRRDAMGELAVPVPLPRKPPAARAEWFMRWYPTLIRDELWALTGYKSWRWVRAAARKLGLPDKPKQKAPLNRVGMEWVELVYPYLSDQDMALDLGVPVPIVWKALEHLGVRTVRKRSVATKAPAGA